MTVFSTINESRYIAAHRGYRSIRPENSPAAFEASIGHCHLIELDVQMSRDGIPVIHHDDILGRTSNAAELAVTLGKTSLQINDWDLAELRQLDMGSWFLDADPFQTLERGVVGKTEIEPLLPQRIMTLDELLAWAMSVDIALNIEIKDQEGRLHDKNIVAAVAASMQRSGHKDLLVSSFRHSYLKEMKAMMPEVPTGVLVEGQHPENLLEYLQGLDASAYHPDAKITTPDVVRLLHSNNYAVNVYTVNDRDQQLRLFRDGVNAIFTDFPDLSVLTELSD